jgi:integrase
MFLTLMLTGLRRFGLLDLRWSAVAHLTSSLRVVESKSEEGERSIALSPTLAEALWQHHRRTPYKGDEDRVFSHQQRGSRIDHESYASKFRAALKAAGIRDFVRPFYDAATRV